MTKRPNIVLFCADQMRYDSVDCLGNPLIRTPNIGSIGRSGARFHKHRTPHQICSPSRATMFTGLYPRHHKLYKNGNTLPESIPTLPGVLAQHGYATHGVGKFHLQPLLAAAEHGMPDSIEFWKTDAAKNWNGPFFGMQTVDTLLGEAQHCALGGHYANWIKLHHPDDIALYDPSNSLAPVPDDLPEVWKAAIPPDRHYNSWIGDRAAEFVSSQSDEQPFFLFVSFPDPHHPFSPPAPYCDRYDPADMPMPNVVSGELDLMPDYLHVIQKDEWLDAAFADYSAPPAGTIEQGMMVRTDAISEATLRQAIAHTYGMVELIDDCVGTVIAEIEKQGMTDDTILIFTVDHGELLGDHGLLRKGAPPYDQLVRLPFLMSGPGVPQNADIDTPTSHIDLLASLCDLAGVEAPESDGLSFAPLLNGTATELPRDAIYGEFYPRAHWNVLNHSVFEEEWRLTLYPRQQQWGELFDRNNDPGEHRNLFNDPAHAAIRKRLSDRLLEEFPPALEEDAMVYGSY